MDQKMLQSIDLNNKYYRAGLFILPLLALLFVFRRVLFFGEVFFNGDATLQFYQYFRLVGEQGSLIVPEMLAGFPLYASVGVGWFYPVNIWFANAIGFVEGYSLLTLFNFFLAYLFTYFYARKINLNHFISIFVATIFTFSAHLMVWGSLLLNSHYFFVLPAVLWLSELLRQRPRDLRAELKQIGIVLLIGCILGLSWLSSHLQFVIYIHAFLVLYFIFLVWQQPTTKNIIHKTIYLVIGFGISLLIGWPQISAVLNLRAFTSRAGGTSLAENFSSTFLPQDIIHYLLPFWNNPIIPTGSPSIYLGILSFIILIFALVSWRKMLVNHYFVFALITFIGSLLLAITYSPLAILLHELPVFDSFRGAQRIMFIGNFGAAVLIGLTLNYIVTNLHAVLEKFHRVLTVLKRVFLYVVLPLILLASIARIFFFDKILTQLENYFLTRVFANTSGLPQEHYLNLINNYLSDTLDQVFIGNWQVISFLVFSILAYYLLKNINNLSAKTVLISVVLLTVFNFSFVYANYYPTVPRQDFVSQPPTAEFIKQHSASQEPFRVFSLFSGLTEFNELVVRCPDSSASDKLELAKALLTPNLNLQHGLDSPDGYDNFMSTRLSKVLAFIGSDRATTGNLLVEDPISVEERVQKFIERKNVLRSLNVRYVISHYQLDDNDFVLLNSQTVGDCQTDVHIYELHESWPRYFLTTNIEQTADYSFESVINELQSSTERGRVILETDEFLEITKSQKQINPVNAVWEGDLVTFNVQTEKDSLLFIGNTWLPGWQATVDGESVEVLKANYAFMAVLVKPGQREIVLKYVR